MILFLDSSHETVPRVTNTPCLSFHYNNDHSPYICTFDHCEQINNGNNNEQRQEIRRNSQNILLNQSNEDEHCQICGDLASGWHCG